LRPPDLDGRLVRIVLFTMSMNKTRIAFAGLKSGSFATRSARWSSEAAGVALAVPWLVACGSAGVGEAPDAGRGASDAAGMADTNAGPEAGNTFADAAPPEGGMLVAGDSLSVRQVTSDGYVVYSNDSSSTLYAVPLAGGSSVHIAPLGSDFWVTGAGPLVFAWSAVDATNVGTLYAWSSSAGAHVVSSASLGLLASASSDGSRILYIDHVDAAGGTGDVYVAASDGTGAVQLLAAQQFAGCLPQLGFAGAYAVISHCDVPRGAGPSSVISSFLPPSWARVDLASAAENLWSADTAATRVLVSTGDGVESVPIGGGQPLSIDATGFLGQLINGGATAIYSTTSHALRRSPVLSPSPMTLVPTFGGFYGVSPDESSVMFFQDFGQTGAGVYLASATAPSVPVTLWSPLTATLIGDGFTADSSHTLYSTGVSSKSGVGTLTTALVSSGATSVLGQDAWSDYATTGAKVVFVDNYVATGGLRFGRGDIESTDLSVGTPPTRLVAGADAVMALSPAKDLVVYSWSAQPGANAGIFTVRVP
jgi:hypothetical protein